MKDVKQIALAVIAMLIVWKLENVLEGRQNKKRGMR